MSAGKKKKIPTWGGGGGRLDEKGVKSFKNLTNAESKRGEMKVMEWLDGRKGFAVACRGGMDPEGFGESRF